MNKGQYSEALEALLKVKTGRNDNAEAAAKLAIMKAEALDHSGNTAAAYDSLLSRVVIKPNDELAAAVKLYGGKLGKNAKQIDADKWKLIDASVKPAPDFDLYAYLERKIFPWAISGEKPYFSLFGFLAAGHAALKWFISNR